MAPSMEIPAFHAHLALVEELGRRLETIEDKADDYGYSSGFAGMR